MKVVICGAGGRDFHVFNMLYRDDEETDVVCFTAAQIPHIDSRTYAVAGPRYPSGIPIRPEAELEAIVEENDVDEVVFAYSDVREEHLHSLQKRVEPLGVLFTAFDPDLTMLDPPRPCVAVCAVRTGCGKSGVSRYVAAVLRECGRKIAVIRHPMPYGALTEKRAVQRFASEADLVAQQCTIEEREEY
ncbi:MAG: GTPase, partial [Gemmatimonadetes bacterium]|nr:GTPase [Gemmatimonadota bacterium]